MRKQEKEQNKAKRDRQSDERGQQIKAAHVSHRCRRAEII